MVFDTLLVVETHAVASLILRCAGLIFVEVLIGIDEYMCMYVRFCIYIVFQKNLIVFLD